MSILISFRMPVLRYWASSTARSNGCRFSLYRLRELIRQGCEARGIVIVQGSVGSVTEETIRRYIENQGTTENDVFKVEN